LRTANTLPSGHLAARTTSRQASCYEAKNTPKKIDKSMQSNLHTHRKKAEKSFAIFPLLIT